MSASEVIDLSSDESDEEAKPEAAAPSAAVAEDEPIVLFSHRPVSAARPTVESSIAPLVASSAPSTAASSSVADAIDLTALDDHATLPGIARAPIHAPAPTLCYYGLLRSSVAFTAPLDPSRSPLQMHDKPIAEQDMTNPAQIRVRHQRTHAQIGTLEPRTAAVLGPYIRQGWIKLQLEVTMKPPQPIRGPARPIGSHPITVQIYGRRSKQDYFRQQLMRSNIQMLDGGIGGRGPQPPQPPQPLQPLPQIRPVAQELVHVQQQIEAEVDSVYSFLQRAAQELEQAEPPPGLKSDLFPYQRQAIHWMLSREEEAEAADEPPEADPERRRRRRRKKDAEALQAAMAAEAVEAVRRTCGGILADEMGLGKTIQVIALVLANPAPPAPGQPPAPRPDRPPALGPEGAPQPPEGSPRAVAEREAPAGGGPEWAGASPPDGDWREGAGPGGVEWEGRGEGPELTLDDIFSMVDADAAASPGPAAPPPTRPPPASAGAGPPGPPGAAADAGGGGKRGKRGRAGGEAGGALVDLKGTLIVCPLSTLSNWTTQLQAHVEPGSLSWYTYHGPGRQGHPAHLARFDVVLTTYTILQCEFEEGEAERGRRGKGKGPARRSPAGPADERERDERPPSAPGLARSEPAPPGPPPPAVGGFASFQGFASLASFFPPGGTLGGPPPRGPPPADRPSPPPPPPPGPGGEAGGSGGSEGEGGARLGPLHRVRWHRVVLDEAHTIKTASTQQSKSACRLAARARWCITGTPVTNKLDDLQSLLQFLRARPLDDPATWGRLIVQPIKQRDPRGAARLRVVMQGLCLRRTKGDKMDGKSIVELPEKRVQFARLTPRPEERELYQRALKASKRIVNDYLAQGTALKNYAHVLQLLLRLRQICDHPELARHEELEGADPLARVLAAVKRADAEECCLCLEAITAAVVTPCAHLFCRDCIAKAVVGGRGLCPLCRAEVDAGQLVEGACGGEEAAEEAAGGFRSSTKLDALVASLLEVRRGPEPEKAVVFTQWVSFMRLIERALKAHGLGYAKLEGGMSARQRAGAIEAFQGDPALAVFLVSLKAGGQGLNLTAASRVYLMDPWWHEAAEVQAIDRVHRVGQSRPVHVVRYIIAGSIEDRILDLQKRKRRVAEATLAPAASRPEASQLRIDDLRLLLDLDADLARPAAPDARPASPAPSPPPARSPAGPDPARGPRPAGPPPPAAWPLPLPPPPPAPDRTPVCPPGPAPLRPLARAPPGPPPAGPPERSPPPVPTFAQQQPAAPAFLAALRPVASPSRGGPSREAPPPPPFAPLPLEGGVALPPLGPLPPYGLGPPAAFPAFLPFLGPWGAPSAPAFDSSE